MRYRLLGRSGLRVSELFLGTMTFGEDWGFGASVEESRKLFEAYAEAGGNVIDTANRYTEGTSEKILGELLGADRDRFVLATKYTLTDDGTDPNASGNHRKNLVRSLDQSLKRLNTDRIDLLWVHIWDPGTPIEETMRALDDQVRAGKVQYIGISDSPGWVVARANTLAEWRGWTPFVGVQVPFSLVKRDADREIMPMVDAMGLSVAAWSPLSGGLLSGKFSRGRATGHTRVNQRDISARDLAVAKEVDAVADELGVSSSQVALAWVMQHGPHVHPVVGARKLEQLEDNLAAVDVRLPDEAVARLNRASEVPLGFPADFIKSMKGFVYGEAGRLTDGLEVGAHRHIEGGDGA
ncbi:aldo/keto reductase [Kitasatospora sp. NPDC001664]|uniref:aldo/keto reductase n=1 Tax=Kitasatospora albolonga TaxID=68173 RepID=UPI0031EC0F6C